MVKAFDLDSVSPEEKVLKCPKVTSYFLTSCYVVDVGGACVTHQKYLSSVKNTHREAQTHRQRRSGICGLNHCQRTGGKVAARSDQSRKPLCPRLQPEADPVVEI
ncbi:unnamed protein product [Pleuronectes platessa]|uniref:Uncharacterized protein n=1 Tax=Pleuronectes platessa TaxID=8262 RepID=A0A9N7VNP9_PLEPL|nr:unnamed protein product [Pleuronectes platessa]